MTRERASLPGSRFAVRLTTGERVLPRRQVHPARPATAAGRVPPAAAPALPARTPPPMQGDGAPFHSGFVAIIGRPNVGKSSLCNRLVGEKVAIVSDKPQTTRTRIMAVLHLPGAQAVLVDTPGIHKPKDGLGRQMTAQAREALSGIEVACLIVDASSPAPGSNDRRAAHHVLAAECPRLLILNKIDLVPEPERPARQAAYAALAPADAPFDEVLLVSATTGAGEAALIAALRARLPEGPAYFPEDAITDRPEQFLAAELVREHALHLLRDEVPHAVAVTVEEWQARDSGVVYIGATLYVERESQKGIVIGKGGAMLRAIGQAARQEIELRLGSPVYLDIRVKVKEDWRDRPGSLSILGLNE